MHVMPELVNPRQQLGKQVCACFNNCKIEFLIIRSYYLLFYFYIRSVYYLHVLRYENLYTHTLFLT